MQAAASCICKKSRICNRSKIGCLAMLLFIVWNWIQLCPVQFHPLCVFMGYLCILRMVARLMYAAYGQANREGILKGKMLFFALSGRDYSLLFLEDFLILRNTSNQTNENKILSY